MRGDTRNTDPVMAVKEGFSLQMMRLNLVRRRKNCILYGGGREGGAARTKVLVQGASVTG